MRTRPPLCWRTLVQQGRAVLLGEGNDFLASENGLVSFLTALVVLIFAVLIGLLANVAYNTRQKLDVQNAADALASSAALWQARGMNAITAANHTSGELAAMCVIQYSFGGPELDDYQENGKYCDTNESKALFQNIKIQYQLANATAKVKTYESTYNQMNQTNGQFKSGATIYDGRLTLEYLFWFSLTGHALGGIISYIPYIGPAVDAIIEGLCAVLDFKILQEWISLGVVETVTQPTVPIRKTVESAVLPLIQTYADMVTRETSIAIDRTVQDLSPKNGVKGAVYPAPTPLTLKLPVEKEKEPSTSGKRPDSPVDDVGGITGTVGKIIRWIGYASDFRSWLSWLPGADSTPPEGEGSLDVVGPPTNPIPTKGYLGNPSRGKLPKGQWDKEQKSQWVRATYPWVNYWRGPIRTVMDYGLTLSLSSAWYLHWSNRYTLAKTHEYRTRDSKKLYMYVMIDSEQYGKGKEPWTKEDGSERADKLFCLLAFAHQPAKTIAMPPVFGKPQQNSKGIVAFSQAMVYNANKQAPGANNGDLQPDIGWNTLNWKSPLADGSNAFEFGKGHDRPNEPLIQLNWQAKLTPVTRLFNEPLILLNPLALPSEHRDVLWRFQLLPGKSMFMNH
jgi:hypothetical protein